MLCTSATYTATFIFSTRKKHDALHDHELLNKAELLKRKLCLQIDRDRVCERDQTWQLTLILDREPILG